MKIFYQITKLFFPLILIGYGCQSNNGVIKTTQTNDQNISEEKLIPTHLLLAQKQCDRGENTQALNDIKLLLKKYPQNAKLVNMLGVIHLSLEHNKKARKLFKQAYDKSPITSHGLNYATSLILTGKTKQARKVLFPLSKDENYHFLERIYHNIGLSYENEGKLQKAKKYYKKSLIENPVFYLSKMQLAKIYQQQGKEKTALKAFRKAADFCQLCFEPVEIITLEQLRKNDKKAARKTLKKFLKQEKIDDFSREKGEKLLSRIGKGKSTH